MTSQPKTITSQSASDKPQRIERRTPTGRLVVYFVDRAA